jgi:hypothetical protein
VNVWVTFLSGNVVNKALVGSTINPSQFVGSNLPQLIWVLSALFKAKKNVYVEEFMVAFKAGNTGGYQLCQVFGVNTNTIFNYFVTSGIPRQYFEIINKHLLKNFFPPLLLTIRGRSSGFTFCDENYFQVLYPIYKNKLSFWMILVPLIKLPLNAASLWWKLVNIGYMVKAKIMHSKR